MSKLTEIEQALQRIDPAGFQRLCDALLYELGYRNINPTGLVIGTDKVKRGTPDALAALQNGKYAFAEYTTQQTGVAEKLLGDMVKCFDEAKTGVPTDRIQHFIACHTSILSPSEEHQLLEEGRRRGCLVTVFGLGSISHHLLQRFPGLAREFLGVELDTGQILTVEEFVAAYGKNAVATPLDTTIRFRDDEISRALADLEASEVLVIAGPAGVGKSRLALEVSRRLAEKHRDIQPRVVLYHGQDLFRDVRTYFATSGSHLVIVDDANHVSGFEHILRLLHEKRDDRTVKVIATVRDYALNKVADDVRPYGTAPILTLNALKDEQIRQILTEDYGIQHHVLSERIIEIAKGNPRLAVMAARVAKREGKLQSLADVSAIYDDYFRSIRNDIADLQDEELLRAAGIVAVFRHVDRKSDAQSSIIADAFQMTPERLWAAVQRLHELEVVDLYEDEVARISDQVLATYLFHTAFFGQRVLEPSSFFHPAFFPQYRRRLFDALNPAASAFNGVAITNAIRPHLRRRWAELERTGDEDRLLELVNSFGSIEETATLKFLKDSIDALPREPAEIAALEFKPVASPGATLWTVLGNLRDSDLPIVRMALGLALDLLKKRPADVPRALALLIERYGIRHTSYLRDYEVEAAVIEALSSRLSTAYGDERVVLTRLFLVAAQLLLRTHFQTHEAKNDSAIIVLSFDVAVTHGLRRLRQTIWRTVGELLEDTKVKSFALEFVRQHARDTYHVTDGELLTSDAVIAIPVLDTTLDPSAYTECVVAQGYLQLLKQRRVVLGGDLEQQRSDLATRLAGRTYELSILLLEDQEDRQDRARMGWEAYAERKRELLRGYVLGRDSHQLEEVLAECVTIRKDLEAEQAARGEAGTQNREEWQLKQSVTTMLQFVAERDPALFVAVIDRYLESGNALDLEAQAVIPCLIATAGPDRAHAIITSHDFPRRGQWLSGYFALLPEEAVTADRLSQLYAHYESATAVDLFRDLDFLAKYERHDSRVVPKIFAVLVGKAQQDHRIGYVLADTFDARGAVGCRISQTFGGSPADIALLKQAYFAASRGDPHFDYNAAAFATLLDLDPDFGAEWVDWRHADSGDNHLSYYDDNRDYSGLWLRDDHSRVLRSILACARANQKWESFSYADVFVTLRDDEPQRAEIRLRQKQFFREWILEAAADSGQMEFVFARAANVPADDRRDLVAAFLARNQRFADFERLPLEPRSWGWSGSQVPLLQERVAFFQSLLPLFDRIELLEHRRQTEKRIAGLQEYIERERKRDFLER